jgi:simple sugar transport system ATP-binding protein/ribose transport system ATP-binding protein
VELRGVTKKFGSVEVLHDLHAAFTSGRVHALVGENGAGKSTLGRLIAGVHAATSGDILIDSTPVHYGTPRQALADGITMIAQELLLVPRRSVIENVFLGTSGDAVTRRRLRPRYDALCETAGFHLPPDAAVGDLRIADQQKVEILRAIARDARLIVMDEPTASLTGAEADRLLDVIRLLRAQGRTVIFVSHFLSQVLAVADTVTVMRDGRIVRQGATEGETADSLVESMLGRTLDQTFSAPAPVADSAATVLEVDGIVVNGSAKPVSLTVRAGEIVGLAGLVGAGRTELVRAIFGADPSRGGRIRIDGVERRIRRPGSAIAAGIAMIPESRKDDGLLLSASIRSNVALPHLSALSVAGVLRLGRERGSTDAAIKSAGVRGASPAQSVSSLSGGNQQKTMFAKWLMGSPRVLIVDEPSRGVDVGSRQTIYDLIRRFAADGNAVLLVSSEIEEVLGLSHRVLVMRDGAIQAELIGTDATEQAVLRAAFGAADTTAPSDERDLS